MRSAQKSTGSLILKSLTVYCLLFLLVDSGSELLAQETKAKPPVPENAEMAVPVDEHSGGWTLVIHGGAGGPARGTMPDNMELKYREMLNQALALGSKMLAGGGSSLETVEAVVRFMEDSPMFNAGKGAVLNENGNAELDAAIMDGRTGMAGAVAGVTMVKNPITAARMVMEKSGHVMLCGKGADVFAEKMELNMVEPDYFITPERMESFKKWKSAREEGTDRMPADDSKGGTVGAVAMDMNGNLAAATSTGGMMGKMAGRVGDSPIIGAGTYANNKTCAVSATGHGEYFIRNVAGYDLSAMMEYKKMTLDEAAKTLIFEKLSEQKATGGLIAVDRRGDIAMPFNTNAMFRGYARENGEQGVEIY